MSAERGASPAGLRARLVQLLDSRPAALEPGLRLHVGVVSLEEDHSISLFGEDALGRPVLFFVVEAFEAGFADQLLGLVAELRSEPQRFATQFARPKEPRLFVVAEDFPADIVQRLELLAEVFSLRAFRFPASAAEMGEGRQGDALPTLIVPQLIVPQAAAAPEGHFHEGEDEGRRLGLRLVRAASALQPAVSIEGSPWPLVFVGRSGPSLSLHRDRDGFLVASHTRGAMQLFELSDDEAVDAAIDRLMRDQWVPLASATES